MLSLLCILLFPALMAFAAASDLFTMTISNRVSLTLIAGFFLVALMSGMSAAAIGVHAGLAAAVLVAAFICFACGWVGGGDAKLAAATVLWLGPDQALNYLIWASLLGGALTLAILRFRAWPLSPVLAGQEWAVRLHRADAGVPYGIALAVAALLVYPDSVFMRSVGF